MNFEEPVFNAFLEHSVHLGGTDIHLCPGAIPYVRVNGVLQALDVNTFTVAQIEGFISELLDSRQAEELRQSRAISFTFAVSNIGRFRSSIYSQRGSFAITIRSLPHEIPTAESLGLPPQVSGVMEKSRGLVLVVGIGAAKSATLACLLDMVNQERSTHISTVENPIEYLHRHGKSLVTQKEIGGDTADFHTGLKWSMREDSDIIMLSEMSQEPEIILQILTAAEEKLVLVGLNAIGTTKAIEYIIDAFSSPTQKEAVTEKQTQVRSRLAGVLECIIHQPPRRRECDAGRNPCEMLILSGETKNFIAEGKFHSLKSKLERRERT
ncbi:MAG: Flp pilus assembly complex ATPase component TadA [Defluviitaleaceae bacterium]|nr:Flp pilus assembly complex ATPase component TadA [Defluviitaleaceae bacterium]